MSGEATQSRLPQSSLGLVAESVKQLRYGANDEEGFYVEALEIGTPQGKNYLLHVFSYSGGHEKVEFETREEVDNWFRAPASQRPSLEPTDETCGYRMDPSLMVDARREGFESRINAS